MYFLGEPWSQLNPAERILLEKAVQEMDTELLASLVKNRRHKNPIVDSETKDTVLHYLAQQESDNVDLFYTIARNIHGLFITNANGMKPIDFAAEKGHFNIVRYICLESIPYMKEKPPLVSRPSTINKPSEKGYIYQVSHYKAFRWEASDFENNVTPNFDYDKILLLFIRMSSCQSI